MPIRLYIVPDPGGYRLSEVTHSLAAEFRHGMRDRPVPERMLMMHIEYVGGCSQSRSSRFMGCVQKPDFEEYGMVVLWREVRCGKSRQASSPAAAETNFH